ncbi:50S ribosomal protein L13 [Candidatus Curtissbacteria bacterium RIFCSPLOWO2_01_FULL_39_62]|uniref:Large ribosomal subunit protein uL13 n=2 Tax=Candidatus Curtissiibacteriota TaxID=1752717 RepID=A0A1F5G7K3_9BACT|nr:MAG: 50S ribosomal protein L13 [Candidatus Curtissbacteria bacterium RIFCSPHIGHO2_01_FULL_39_57]OGD87804.1 MAG: 50S ribosomal protein L13 [Candidatus Curtissbacteria bacterium RIFCSPHIGHO2_02_FULL_40_16b]OGD90557.1 MAG: 50S ribosomal protein L13 [Candidatus Curtissbacteria bacterium RIFCSPHIGHO2_12_FULL_38_37]OGD99826.1 MAG: 50S ribosomal protein L13 [Candidatus Curtissbacteria bacterium RIFCSPLOWO2_02_FULL_40_11]OGE01068.1 MAG: 50S ribosomal protein L13 [Candidatus Curtissbacteria bacterium
MKNVKPKDIKRGWHLIDANNQILGRLSSGVATHLMGKNKNYYVSHLDTGDFVVVINAEKVKLSGKKESQKKYYRHSGYPGGLYVKTAAQTRSSKPEFLVRHAVRGMLPKTTLGKQMLKKLYVYTGSQHKHNDKFTGNG